MGKSVYCRACERESETIYRCEHCGRDLTKDSPEEESHV